jgi:hypothetical protein
MPQLAQLNKYAFLWYVTLNIVKRKLLYEVNTAGGSKIFCTVLNDPLGIFQP